jgi:putative lipoic acid-binding regulatory protein
MQESESADAFYKRLKTELEKSTDWPSQYLYKFIAKSNQELITSIENTFDNMGAVIKTRTSGKGNYTSVSVHLVMSSPEAVIEKYKQVAALGDIILL